MTHNINVVNGRASMAYSGDKPWHNLGTDVGALGTVGEMLAAANMLYTVELAPVFAEVNGVRVEIPDRRMTYRSDTGQTFEVVSDRYRTIQNTEAGDMMDAIITTGGAHVETAGALGRGEVCWLLAKLPDTFEVTRGDAIDTYALVAWGHDGKHCVAARLTPVRVVCQNTLAAAGFGSGKWSTAADVAIRHRASASLRIDEAREALGLIRKQSDVTLKAYEQLARTVVSDGDATAYFAAIFPPPAVPRATESESDALTRLMGRVETPEQAATRLLGSTSKGYEESRVRWEARQDSLTHLYHGGAGATPGTAWGAYNAVTEYTDHVYPVLDNGRTSANRQESVLFGAYGDTKRRAFLEALALG